MEQTDWIYQNFLQVLQEELIPAMGCTEPISLAYAAAKARQELGVLPELVVAKVSGNIIKNVKSVVVPNTGGLKGIEAALAAGIMAGRPEKVLEVLAQVEECQKCKIKEFLSQGRIEVNLSEEPYVFYFSLSLYQKDSVVTVIVKDYHTNIVSITKNGMEIYAKEEGRACEIAFDQTKRSSLSDRTCLNIRDIVAFADIVEIEKVKEVLDRQISYNTRIAEEGIKKEYGAGVGKVLLDTYGSDVKIRAKAKAAAGSDARMSGCELPVVIVSGSGNQGMAASIPVIEYAKELCVEPEKLYRALVVSNLITIHQKTGIGRLSAFCGAVSAGCASGAGIAYLLGKDYMVIAHTLVNALAIVSGIICDGAKPSCAAKIAASVDAGILGYHMYLAGKEFKSGDGIVTKGVEATIQNVGRLGKEGMKETDKEILNIMLGK